MNSRGGLLVRSAMNVVLVDLIVVLYELIADYYLLGC